MRFKVIFCFTNSKGNVESDEYGEIYHSTIVKCDSYQDVLKAFLKQEKFMVLPDVVSIEFIGGTENE